MDRFESRLHKVLDVILFLVPFVYFIWLLINGVGSLLSNEVFYESLISNYGSSTEDIFSAIYSQSLLALRYELNWFIEHDFGLSNFIFDLFGRPENGQQLPFIVVGFMSYGVWWAFLDLAYSVFRFFFTIPKLLLDKLERGIN